MAILLNLFLFAAFERYLVSAQSQALAYACVATASGVDAIRLNPAGMLSSEKNIIGLGYEYTFSNIEGLQNIYLGFYRHMFHGGLGIKMSQFGFEEQKENAMTTAYSISLSKEFFVGAGVNLYMIQNRRTGTGIAYGVSLGMLGMVSKKWFLGACAHNLNQPRFGNGEIGTMPASLQAGIGYKPFNDIGSEIDLRIEDRHIDLRASGTFRIMDFLNLRTGMQTNPVSVSAGFGIIYRFMNIDYACSYFIDLPLNHSVSIQFSF